MIYELKIAPRYLDAIKKGVKKFEVRYNDRGYQTGDILRLKEYADLEYTGEQLDVLVTYTLTDPTFCKEGFVIMSIVTLTGGIDNDR